MMPFPPMVDLLKWPIISELLEVDIDADTMQARFEELEDEIEDQIRSWASTVEAVLVNTLKTSSSPADSDDWNLDSEGPPLQLEYEIPPETPLMDRLTPTTRLLLRADSVFRVSEDTIAPLPLYYPEIFPVLQARPDGYCTIAFQKFEYYRPKDGYTWDPSEVLHYPEGCAAAKELLRELGRVDAAQFELQALGARFTCGSCDDNWVRTWNEMVQHYAEAIAHANAVKKAKASVRKQVKYKNVHSFDKTKRKGKSLVIFHKIEDAKMLSSERREREKLVRCNLCEQLGVDFQSPRDVMRKHVHSAHSIKSPKAEHYNRTSNTRSHTKLSDPTGIVSDSTEATDQDIADKIASRYSIYGAAAFWSYYGRHSILHPGWDWRDF
ncbi:hypothetical protein RSOLAG22IIIB_13746 [Rhizoctonia solani]|uniref:Uncharacterized protein n=1 Tax=Rhizoctonia solani TaxID=456999 RepID=A0A0K6FQG5_9AGAM|nr:hypothetical protein RSOLAG22IIIB_13746 [Rhizoctonia solani]